MVVGKDILLVVISIFLIIFLVSSSILFTANTFLYPAIYQKVLEKNGVYGYVENSTEQVPGGQFIETSNGSMKPIVDGLLVNLLSYLRGDSKELNLNLSINGDELRAFFVKQTEDFPICAQGQNAYEGEEVICRPSNQTPNEFMEDVLKRKNMTLPQGGNVDLKEVYGLKDEDLKRAKSFIWYYQMVLYGFVIFSLLLIGLIFLVTKDLKMGMRWTGVNSAIVGMIIVIVSFSATNFIPTFNIDLQIIQNVINDVIQILLFREKTQGIVFAVVGVGLFGASFFIGQEDKKKK